MGDHRLRLIVGDVFGLRQTDLDECLLQGHITTKTSAAAYVAVFPNRPWSRSGARLLFKIGMTTGLWSASEIQLFWRATGECCFEQLCRGVRLREVLGSDWLSIADVVKDFESGER